MAVTQEIMAESDPQVNDHAHRSMVPGRDVTAEAAGVLGAVDGGKGVGALFDRIVGNDIMRFAVPDVLGKGGFYGV